MSISDTVGNGNANIQGNGLTLRNAGNTIQGTGDIGDGGTLAIINGGTIDANSSSGTGQLLLDGRGGITNTNGATGGLLEASGGGRLLINGITVNNANGNIATGDASGIVALVNNATIQGGTLNNTAGGTLETGPGNTGTLDGHTAAGAVTIDGIYTASNSATTNIIGTITDNDTIQLTGGGGTFGDLVLTGDATLNGSGHQHNWNDHRQGHDRAHGRRRHLRRPRSHRRCDVERARHVDNDGGHRQWRRPPVWQRSDADQQLHHPGYGVHRLWRQAGAH